MRGNSSIARKQGPMSISRSEYSLKTRNAHEPEHLPEDLHEEIHETVDGFAPIAAEKNLKLNVKWPDEPLWVDGDPGRLGQVLGNLLSNASGLVPCELALMPRLLTA